MRDILFHLDPESGESLQAQLHHRIADAVISGQLAAGEPIPSSRRLAKQLGIARNTVILTYQRLVEQGFLISRQRSGYYVNDDILANTLRLGDEVPFVKFEGARVQWQGRLARRPSVQRNIDKPKNWHDYPYPFIYGQLDQTLFPLAAWRECSRQALAKLAVNEWSADQVIADDPMLIEQIRTRVLPRRGVAAAAEEILITIGAQNALWILSSLLVREDTVVGVENPGYVDARNIFALRAKRVLALAVDHEGLKPLKKLGECDYVYATPSHQSPTTVTMPLERRKRLLELAHREDFVIIEDDYEGETNYVGEATPALKSLDRAGRVIYVGSLSKHLAPGLRLGFLVGDAELIEEARHLRRLILRHPPANNQRCLALFMAQGYFDSLVRKLHREYHQRWELIDAAVARYLPHSTRAPTFGGSSFWVEGPADLDAGTLALEAAKRGVLIEPGDIHFMQADPPRNFYRLGFSSIPTERIEDGIKLLAAAAEERSERRAG